MYSSIKNAMETWGYRSASVGFLLPARRPSSVLTMSGTPPSLPHSDWPTPLKGSWPAARTPCLPEPRSPRRCRGACPPQHHHHPPRPHHHHHPAAPRRRPRTGRGRGGVLGNGWTPRGSWLSGAPGWGSGAPGRWSVSAPAAASEVSFQKYTRGKH